VILPEGFPLELLEDSKKLSPAARERAREALYGSGALWGIGWVSAAEIDAINIHHASLLAMRRAFLVMAADPRCAALLAPPAGGPSTGIPSSDGRITAIADGRFAPELPVACRALVKADAQIPEVMAASIIAKTARDRVMERYSWLYPEYGYEQHKGYPTKLHYERIARFGPSPIQRMSFRWN
jgi:ribonuclease HII